MGKGQYVENKNVESLKVDQKFEKDQNVKSLFFNWSERQKWSGWSECQKSERQKECQKSKMTFDFLIFFDAIGNIRMSKCFVSFSTQKHFWCSDFTYGVRKDQNVKNRKDQLPMAYYLCEPRPVGG